MLLSWSLYTRSYSLKVGYSQHTHDDDPQLLSPGSATLDSSTHGYTQILEGETHTTTETNGYTGRACDRLNPIAKLI